MCFGYIFEILEMAGNAYLSRFALFIARHKNKQVMGIEPTKYVLQAPNSKGFEKIVDNAWIKIFWVQSYQNPRTGDS